MRLHLRHQNYNKKFLLFFTKYNNEWKEHKFWRQKNQKKWFLQNQTGFKIDEIDVNKILVSKKSHMVQISLSNISLDIMMMMLLDHYA